MNKRENIKKYKKYIIGISGLIILCLIVIVIGTIYEKQFHKHATILDSSENVIAEIYRNDSAVQYDCSQDDYAYVDLVWNEAVEQIMSGENINKDKAISFLLKNGMSIQTTFDKELQFKLIETVKNQKDKIDGNLGAVLNDIHGNVLAAYSTAQLEKRNYTLALSYAGSTIKPLSVYGPAIESNEFYWSSMMEDCAYMQVREMSGKYVEWPQNTEPFTNAFCTIADGLKKSMNTIAVHTLKAYGVNKSCDFLEEQLGIDITAERTYFSLKGEDSILSNIALGYLEAGVTVKDMAGYYQIFANGGSYDETHAIITMKKDDETIFFEYKPQQKQILSEQSAYICNRMLKRVVEDGGTAESIYMENVQLCGKTGTTDDYKDNWFVGFTPQYVCAVWNGSEYGINNPEDKICLSITKELISQLEQDGLAFTFPSDIEVCQYCCETGLLASEQCDNTAIAYYKSICIPKECDANH